MLIARITSDEHRKKMRYKWINKAEAFLGGLIPMRRVPSFEHDPVDSFFKGVWIQGGILHYCIPRVESVGELIHEAAHFCICEPHQRYQIAPGADPPSPPLGILSVFGDAAAEAWTYAATLAAEPDMILASYDHGFNGMGIQTWETLKHGYHPGFALLRLLGMSNEYGIVQHWNAPRRAIAPDENLSSLLADFSKDELNGLVSLAEKMLPADDLLGAVLEGMRTSDEDLLKNFDIDN